MAITNVANDQQLMTVRGVTETTPGGGGTPTFILPGTFDIAESRPLADIESYTGTYVQDAQIVYGPTDLSGSYGQNLSFEKAAILARYSVATAPTPVSDGNATPGYTWTYNHDQARATRQTMAAIAGFEELPFDVRGIRLPQLSFSCDVDDAQSSWKVNSPSLFATSKDLWMRLTGTASAGSATTLTTAGLTTNAYQNGWLHLIKGTGAGQALKIASNTTTVFTVTGTFSPAPDATTVFVAVGPVPSVSATTDETINAEGTSVYIDDYGDAIGTTNDQFRVISWNVDWNWPVNPKRFQGNVGVYDAKVGNGPQRLTGSIRVEFDSPKDYQRFKLKGTVALRFKQTGSVINVSPATNKSIQIDVYRAALEGPTMDARNSNRTVTIPFRGYLDSTANKVWQLVVKNRLATLP